MIRRYLIIAILLVIGAAAASAQGVKYRCIQLGGTPVGGVLITNIGAINGDINLGPVFGDLAGSVAAQIVGQGGGTYTLQHFWVTATGDSINFAPAILHPTFPTGDQTIVAVPWGNYRSEIKGGTGRFNKAWGYLDYFGIADFSEYTLVLRYRGCIHFAK